MYRYISFPFTADSYMNYFHFGVRGKGHVPFESIARTSTTHPQSAQVDPYSSFSQLRQKAVPNIFHRSQDAHHALNGPRSPFFLYHRAKELFSARTVYTLPLFQCDCYNAHLWQFNGELVSIKFCFK